MRIGRRRIAGAYIPSNRGSNPQRRNGEGDEEESQRHRWRCPTSEAPLEAEQHRQCQKKPDNAEQDASLGAAEEGCTDDWSDVVQHVGGDPRDRPDQAGKGSVSSRDEGVPHSRPVSGRCHSSRLRCRLASGPPTPRRRAWQSHYALRPIRVRRGLTLGIKPALCPPAQTTHSGIRPGAAGRYARSSDCPHRLPGNRQLLSSHGAHGASLRGAALPAPAGLLAHAFHHAWRPRRPLG